jgi:hypothetical protein
VLAAARKEASSTKDEDDTQNEILRNRKSHSLLHRL